MAVININYHAFASHIDFRLVGHDLLPGIEGIDKDDATIRDEWVGFQDVNVIEINLFVQVIEIIAHYVGFANRSAASPDRIPLTRLHHRQHQRNNLVRCIGLRAVRARLATQGTELKS